MTLVIARQFGDRIVVLSDTMISDETAVRQNILPGRLKSIVIDRRLSIAFAGPATIGLDTIKTARKLFEKSQNLDEIILLLKAESERPVNSELRCDFLVTSHLRRPSLYKIWNGNVSDGQPFQWIGNQTVAAKFREHKLPTITAHELTKMEHDEFVFCHKFTQIIDLPAGMALDGVGGLAVVQRGSSDGHCYDNHAGSFCSDSIALPHGISSAQLAARASGMTEYRYNCYAPAECGVAVLGAFFDQLGTGYIYDPLEHDDAIQISPTTLSELGEQIEILARSKSSPAHP